MTQKITKKDIAALAEIADHLYYFKIIKDDSEGDEAEDNYKKGFADGLEQGKIRERQKIRSLIDSNDPYYGL